MEVEQWDEYQQNKNDIKGLILGRWGFRYALEGFRLCFGAWKLPWPPLIKIWAKLVYTCALNTSTTCLDFY